MVTPFMASATSGRAMVTPMGSPLPRPLALVMMSGCDAPVLDAEPLAAGAAPGGLDFVGDEDATVLAHDIRDDFEVLFGRSDEAADALDRLGDEAGDAAGGGGADDLLDILRAFHFAGRVFEAERAAIAIRVDGMHDAGLGRAESPGGLSGERHGGAELAVIGVAERDDFGGTGEAAGGEDGGLVGLGAAVGEERFGKLPPGVICASFLASATCGSLTKTVETCSSLSICRWTFGFT